MSPTKIDSIKSFTCEIIESMLTQLQTSPSNECMQNAYRLFTSIENGILGTERFLRFTTISHEWLVQVLLDGQTYKLTMYERGS